MKGRCAIRRCSSQLELKTKKNETEVRGLWSVPDDVFVNCLAPKLSRLDLVALSMVSRRYRFVAVLHEIRALRSQRSVDLYMYVFMHMYPDPSPRWFVLHPVQRRLKPVNLNLYPAPAEGSCFVETGWGIYTIGGLMNGKPTSEVTFFDCTDHEVCRVTPMKVARSGASACLIDRQKIYVFGGCWDDVAADSSNWVEVYDIETGTWEFLSVFTPKMPLKIQQSVVMFQKHVYAVDEDGQLFISPTSGWKFKADGRTESNPENRNDWLFADHTLFCRGIGGKILWRFPPELDWKEVKGLEDLQQQHCGFYIIKLCLYSNDSMAIFWESRPQGPDQIFELWCAQISMERRPEGGVLEVWGNIEWSAPVLSDSSYTGLNLLFAGFDDMDSIYASPDDFRQMRERNKAKGLHLLEFFVNKCHDIGVGCEAWIRKGDPTEVICHEVRRVRPDFLVVGSRGLGPFQKVFVGTVSEFCVKHAECPVITIKRSAEESPQDPADD